MELWGKDARFRGAASPVFYSRSGEALTVPGEFQGAAVRISAAVCCVGCRHCHLLEPKPIAPTISGMSAASSSAAGVVRAAPLEESV